MKLPKKPSTLFLSLFLLLFGINAFLGVGLLGLLTGAAALVAAVFFLIGK